MFCKLSKNLIKEGITRIENVFFSAYLAEADGTDIKVYLYGLHLAQNQSESGNNIDGIALKLNLTKERVRQAFKFWAEKDLVLLPSGANEDFVTFLPIKAPLKPIVKINAVKYKDFVEDLYRIFPEKVFTEEEIVNFCSLMEAYKMDINAMLRIVQYCKNINRVSVQKILKTAEDFARQGSYSELAVATHIEELELNNEDMQAIYRALGLKSLAGYEERQIYLKWTKEYNYDLGLIIFVAKSLKKRGGMERLDLLLAELKTAGCINLFDAEAYIAQKESVKNLAVNISRTLGLYYASLDSAVKFYINPWKSYGFTDEALMAVAEYCFIKNVRSLDSMNNVVKKFYSVSALTTESINAYIDRQIQADNSIKEVLLTAGSSGFVANKDREIYKTIIEDWGFSHETVLETAKFVLGNPFPFTAIAKKLSVAKEKGLSGSELSEFLTATGTGTISTQKPYNPKNDGIIKQTYTKEQLESIILPPTYDDSDEI
ncbi:MAG: hypothetical protein FWD49_04540 [Firmicutes bacterium]|nr:hypothetical protein [Bacillota bacterium]